MRRNYKPLDCLWLSIPGIGLVLAFLGLVESL